MQEVTTESIIKDMQDVSKTRNYQNNKIMKIEDLKAKFQPRQLDSQIEFENVMSEMNLEQSRMMHPLIDREIELIKKQSHLQEKIYEAKNEMELIRRAKMDLGIEKKEICRAFHELKHAYIVMNPKERFLNVEH